MNTLTLTTPTIAAQQVQDTQIAQIEQHSLVKTIILHLLPGALIYGIFL